jgi:hypothetical protein
MVSTRRGSRVQYTSAPQNDILRSNRSREKVENEAGAARTSPSDLELVERFRDNYLRKERTILDGIRTFWAKIEVHSGAYMFDVREHVLFYTVFAVIVYLVAKSLVALVVKFVQ